MRIDSAGMTKPRAHVARFVLVVLALVALTLTLAADCIGGRPLDIGRTQAMALLLIVFMFAVGALLAWPRIQIQALGTDLDTAEALRYTLLACGIVTLVAAIISPQLRALLLANGAMLSIVILVLGFLTLLPAKAFLLAVPLGVAALFVVQWISTQKMAAIGLPLSYLDLVNFASDPSVVIHALGLNYSEALARASVAMVVIVVLAIAVLATRNLSPRRASYRLAEAGVIATLGFSVLGAAATDLRDRLPQLFPKIESELWQPSGQQMLAQSIGPLEYLAFTRLLGDAHAARIRVDHVPPLPAVAIASSAEQLIGRHFPREQPNIVFFHAESTFDPNEIFHLAEEIDLPLWTTGPETHLFAPLRVNVVGGGTWVTEFEVLTGVDSRSFGYHGFYTHQMIGPRVGHGFPAYLAERGYETSAYYSEKADFFSVAAAFEKYGIQSFHDAPAIGILPWSDDDLTMVEKMIAHGAVSERERPFFSFISTNHNRGPHPCRNFEDSSQFIVQFKESASFEHNCALNEYLLRAKSTSAAVTAVLDELRQLERATGRPYVVLIYGDHQPWNFTDGFYSIAGGVSMDRSMLSFAEHRKGPNEQIALLHLISSVETGERPVLEQPVPVTLVPTLVSAYLAADWSDLYLPVNLLAYQECGSDFRIPGCALAEDMDLWGRAAILRDH